MKMFELERLVNGEIDELYVNGEIVEIEECSFCEDVFSLYVDGELVLEVGTLNDILDVLNEIECRKI